MAGATPIWLQPARRAGQPTPGQVKENVVVVEARRNSKENRKFCARSPGRFRLFRISDLGPRAYLLCRSGALLLHIAVHLWSCGALLGEPSARRTKATLAAVRSMPLTQMLPRRIGVVDVQPVFGSAWRKWIANKETRRDARQAIKAIDSIWGFLCTCT